jgi:hypothetical protein
MSLPPNQHSKTRPPQAVRDVPLVIKDSLREIRFSATMGAKRWVQEMEGVLSNIPKVGPTLGAATKTATQLLKFADRAAVDSFSTENHYRRAEFRLLAPQFYLFGADQSALSKLFVKNHYWALKHLLKLKNKTDFFVQEESVSRSLRYFKEMQSALAKSPDSSPPFVASAIESRILSAQIIDALYRSKPLLSHAGASQDPEALAESTATLTLHSCVSVVLAGEISPFFPNVSAKTETLEALKLADEVCGARLGRWENAILHKDPIYQLALELDFSIRHL